MQEKVAAPSPLTLEKLLDLTKVNMEIDDDFFSLPPSKQLSKESLGGDDESQQQELEANVANVGDDVKGDVKGGVKESGGLALRPVDVAEVETGTVETETVTVETVLNGDVDKGEKQVDIGEAGEKPVKQREII